MLSSLELSIITCDVYEHVSMWWWYIEWRTLFVLWAIWIIFLIILSLFWNITSYKENVLALCLYDGSFVQFLFSKGLKCRHKVERKYKNAKWLLVTQDKVSIAAFTFSLRYCSDSIWLSELCLVCKCRNAVNIRNCFPYY